jgi:hypothetical protein
MTVDAGGDEEKEQRPHEAGWFSPGARQPGPLISFVDRSDECDPWEQPCHREGFRSVESLRDEFLAATLSNGGFPAPKSEI